MANKFTASYEQGILTLIPFHKMQYWWFLTFDETKWNVYTISGFGQPPKFHSEHNTLKEAFKIGTTDDGRSISKTQ